MPLLLFLRFLVFRNFLFFLLSFAGDSRSFLPVFGTLHITKPYQGSQKKNSHYINKKKKNNSSNKSDAPIEPNYS
jgi:hypothetical protein